MCGFGTQLRLVELRRRQVVRNTFLHLLLVSRCELRRHAHRLDGLHALGKPRAHLMSQRFHGDRVVVVLVEVGVFLASPKDGHVVVAKIVVAEALVTA